MHATTAVASRPKRIAHAAPMAPPRAIGPGYGKKSACVKSLTLELRTMCQSNHQLATLERVTRDAQDDHFRRSSRHRCDDRRVVDRHIRQVETCRPSAGHRDAGVGLAARNHGQAGQKPPGRILGPSVLSKSRSQVKARSAARRHRASAKFCPWARRLPEAALVYAMIPNVGPATSLLGS